LGQPGRPSWLRADEPRGGRSYESNSPGCQSSIHRDKPGGAANAQRNGLGDAARCI